jgi:hypothetical protein
MAAFVYALKGEKTHTKKDTTKKTKNADYDLLHKKNVYTKSLERLDKLDKS